jgi:hypothetical protein
MGLACFRSGRDFLVWIVKIFKTLKDLNKCIISVYIRSRVGKFRIPPEILYVNDETTRLIFHKVYVLRADNDLASNTIEYTALSELFDIVEEGFSAPTYIPVLTLTPFITKIEWTKCEHSYEMSKMGETI